MDLKSSLPTTRCGQWKSLQPNQRRFDKANIVFRLLTSEPGEGSLPRMGWEGLVSTVSHNTMIAVCPGGGGIAIATVGEDRILLFNSVGVALGSISLPTPVIGMAWDGSRDVLLVVTSNAITPYSSSGNPVAEGLPVLGEVLVALETGVGMALVTNDRAGWVEADLTGVYRMATVRLHQGVSHPLSAIAAVRRSVSESGYPELYMSPEVEEGCDAVVYVAQFRPDRDPICAALPPIPRGPIVRMAFAPNERRVAMVTGDGRLLTSTPLMMNVDEVFDLETTAIPAQLMWLGDSAIAVAYLEEQFDEEYQSSLDIIHYTNGELRESFGAELPSSFRLVQECDGLRIVSPESVMYIQLMPLSAQRLWTVGSKHPAAILMNAYDALMQQDSGSIMSIRSLASDPHELEEAIGDCVDGALLEWEVPRQQRLLRIAAFGRSFLTVADTEPFVHATTQLRALHTLRGDNVGMCLSYASMRGMEDFRVVDRLAGMRQFELAFQLTTVVGAPPKHLALRWATDRIITSHDDKGDTERIVARLRAFRSVSFAELALIAKEHHRPTLAVMLMDYERNPLSQAQVLLELDPERALDRAIASGDPDVLTIVVLRWLKDRGASVFERLKGRAEAYDLLMLYVLYSDRHLQNRSSFLEDRPVLRLALALQEYLRQCAKYSAKVEKHMWSVAQEAKCAAIQTAEEAAATLPSRDERCYAEMLTLQQYLLTEQETLAEKANSQAFLSASVFDTVRLCIEHQQVNTAEKLRVKFRITDKQFQCAKLRALINSQDWNEVDKMGKSKLAISFSMFATFLLAAKRPEHARQYALKVQNLAEKLELLIQCGAWEVAAGVCVSEEDPSLLRTLRDRAKGNSEALAAISRGETAKPQKKSLFGL